MPQIFYFMLKVILCSGILFGYYHLFLKNKIYHAYNRYYLLGAVVLSLLIPTIKVDIYNSNEETPLQSIQMLQAVNNSDAYIEEIITAGHTKNIEVSDVLTAGYTAISLVLLVSLVLLLFRMYSLVSKSEKNILGNIVLINSTAEGTPFSFLRYLFWNNDIDINTETGRHIFSHELAHIKEKHSLDKIFLNVVLVICWINPFFWLIRKELNMIHEFIADKKAVGQYDTAVLASMIIQTAYPKHNFLITNHFFYSPIKRRLEMLSKYKSTRTTYFTRILALPILFILIAAFTFKAKDALTATSEKEFVVVIDAGHGGNDEGATAYDGSFEKDINLALAKKVLALNTNKYLKIILTRESDVYQSPQEKASFSEKANANLFVSIHTSSERYPARQTSGMEVYVAKDNFPNSASSKIFASALIHTFSSNYKLDVKPNPMQRPVGVWVLQAAKCPAVLIEAGYISNKKDKAYLNSPEGVNDFAENILTAINRYINEVETLDSEKLLPTIKPSASGMPIKDYINDTLPKNRSSTEITVIDDAKIIIQNNDEDSKQQNAIIVIDDKIYDVKLLNNKMIVGKKARVYGKNNKMIIEKYGKRAVDGAIIFEQGAIKDLPSGKYDVVIDRANKSELIDASQMLNDQKLSLDHSIIQLDELKTSTNTRSVMLNRVIDSLDEPLYLLDGKRILLPTLKTLDPKLIESVRVLKGTTAERYYGAKGKNGAVLIATKQVKELSVERENNLSEEKINDVEELVIDGRKLQASTINANTGNTLFIGIDNSIRLVSETYPINKLYLNGSAGQITGSNGKYIIRVNSIGETKINIMFEGKILKTYTFSMDKINVAQAQNFVWREYILNADQPQP